MPICMIFIVAAEESITLLFGPQYAASAIVFRLYSIWTLLRIAAFGNVITAAGKPQFVLQAAGLSFLANIALSVPLTLWLGYYGAALGTLVSFIPMILFYCAKISEATDVPFRKIYPTLEVLRILAVLALPATGALVLKENIMLHAGVELAICGGVVLVGFALLGTPGSSTGYLALCTKLDDLENSQDLSKTSYQRRQCRPDIFTPGSTDLTLIG